MIFGAVACGSPPATSDADGVGTSSSVGASSGSADASTVDVSSESSSDAVSEVGSGSGDGSIGTGGGTGGGEDLPRYLQYIRSEPFPRLVVEVDYVEGRTPYPVSVTGIESVFEDLLDKPSGVDVIVDQPIPATPDPDRAWTADAMRTLAEDTYDLPVAQDTIKIHVLVLDGHADGEGSTVFGIAWDHLNIVLFRDLYVAACSDALLGALQQPLCEQTEFLVWQHEMGHVIGLVDAGVPMVEDHKAIDRGPHDADRECVMFPDYEGTDAIAALVDQLVAGAPPIEFDQHCLDDIEAAKN
jgi:hypothetical protein